MSDLTNRVILITGATGGLGQSVTAEFLKTGAQVVGVARHWKDHQPQDRLAVGEADLTLAEDCRDTVRGVVEKFGRLDGLVHLMGGFAGGTGVADTSGETWDEMLRANLTPAFHLAKAALPVMRKAGWGRIVAIGSRPGLDPVAGLSAYAVSKAGLHALIRTIAAEVKNTGITANAVMPSTIDTAANRKAMPEADFSKWVKPESIAGLLVWLVSEAGSDVNGALIPIG